MDIIQQGSDVLVATPTASGKSLIYNLPVMDTYLRQPDARYLYLFPLKALAQDQLRTLQKLYAAVTDSEDGQDAFSAIYDGDTSCLSKSKNKENSPDRSDHQS